MKQEAPLPLQWFMKLNLIHFKPWVLRGIENYGDVINGRFDIEHNGGRQVLSFANRLDTDTFAGFEVIDNQIQENVIVFHPSFQVPKTKWNIIQNEYADFYEFMQLEILPTMKEWLAEDDIKDDINPIY